MRIPTLPTLTVFSVALALAVPAQAADADLAEIRAQLQAMKDAYESRIAALESRLVQAESTAGMAAKSAEQSAGQAQAAAQQAGQHQSGPAAFNPETSLILSGMYTKLSQDPALRRLQGFLPANGEKLPEGRSFQLGESELGFAANVDHLFRGDFRLALAPDNSVGVEEANIRTLGLGHGFNVKAGRFLSGVGYLNEQHAHTWDFSDAPLPYQVFFGNQLGLDGVQARWLAPTESFVEFLEFGVETARARSFPATDATRNKNGFLSGAAFVHAGGDVGVANSWRAGLSYFAAQPRDRVYEDGGLSNSFSGNSKTWIADFLWKWAPNGNAKVRNLKLQGEYFQRREDGTLVHDVDNPQAGGYDARQSGFYAQAVYQFLPQWRVGYRYDRLDAGAVNLGPTLAGLGFPLLEKFTPRRNSAMIDWSPSEFSRLRLQFAQDKTRPEATDNQLWLHYIMSLGAHGAHSF